MMQYWDKMKRPPESALKTIKGGRLRGMTDISPIWRYQIMTELFGPCGIGWKFAPIKKWTEEGTDGQKFAFVDIELFVKVGEAWSYPIPGTGGHMLIVKESAGLHNNDEAYKMATTDALSTAMKLLGVGADIHAGLFDGSKYANREEAKPAEKTPAKAIDLDALKTQVAICQTEDDLADLMKTHQAAIKKASNKEDAVALFTERKKEILHKDAFEGGLKE